MECVRIADTCGGGGSASGKGLASSGGRDRGAVPNIEVLLPPKETVGINPGSASEEERLGAALQSLLGAVQAAPLRAILSDGDHEDPLVAEVTPFVFHTAEGDQVPAEGSGLEGFAHTLNKLMKEGQFEQGFFSHAKNYLHKLLDRNPYASITFLKSLDQLASFASNEAELNSSLCALVNGYVRELRSEIQQLDVSHSTARNLTCYHIFIRAFDLETWREQHQLPPGPTTGAFFRDLTETDLRWFVDHGFNSIRLMGTYRIGQVGSKGRDGAGSPFAIDSHVVDPQHGSPQEVRRAIQLMNQVGLKAAFEFVPNHTSCDSILLDKIPTAYIHTFIQPHDMRGWFSYHHQKLDRPMWIRHGGYFDEETKRVEFWNDTLQLDFSNPGTRDFIIAQVENLVENYGVDIIRIDSAFQLLNGCLTRNWGGQNGLPSEMAAKIPDREFLSVLIARVKQRFPETVFIAEALGGSWSLLSGCGFDLVYGLNHMPRKGEHTHLGWHESLKSRSPETIRQAMSRARYLRDQVGGADIITFIGQHDLGSPARLLGEWFYGATALTYLKPGAVCVYNGVETDFEDPCDEDHKVLTFNRPTKIDWTRMESEQGRYILNLMKDAARIKNLTGPGAEMIPLTPGHPNESWVGFLIRGEAPLHQEVIVIANPWGAPTTVTIQERPELLLSDHGFLDGVLPGCGRNGVAIIEL